MTDKGPRETIYEIIEKLVICNDCEIDSIKAEDINNTALLKE